MTESDREQPRKIWRNNFSEPLSLSASLLYPCSTIAGLLRLCKQTGSLRPSLTLYSGPSPLSLKLSQTADRRSCESGAEMRLAETDGGSRAIQPKHHGDNISSTREQNSSLRTCHGRSFDCDRRQMEDSRVAPTLFSIHKCLCAPLH